jgi:hypothetical protein
VTLVRAGISLQNCLSSLSLSFCKLKPCTLSWCIDHQLKGKRQLLLPDNAEVLNCYLRITKRALRHNADLLESYRAAACASAKSKALVFEEAALILEDIVVEKATEKDEEHG